MRESNTPSSVNANPSTITLFASVVAGKADSEEIAFGNYRDECFVLATTDPTHPLKKDALALTIDTALWAFKLVRLRPFYRHIGDKLLYRIARSTNILLWQKQREPQYAKGLSSQLLVAIAGEHNMLIGFVGKSEAYLWRSGQLTSVMTQKGDREGVRTLLLGKDRYGIHTATYSMPFLHEDTYLLVNEPLIPLLKEEIITKYLSASLKTNAELNVVVPELLSALTKGKPGGMYGLALIKRIRVR